MAGEHDPKDVEVVGTRPTEESLSSEAHLEAPESAAPPVGEAGPGSAQLPIGEPWDEVARGYEREAQARDTDPAAARLWHEAGLVYEEQLAKPRQAAVCYQTAFRLAPDYRPNVQSARRLFAGVGNWAMVATLLQAEADATPEPELKTDLLFERAVLLHDRLGKQGEAVALLDALLVIRSDGLSALKYLEGLAVRAGDHARMADLYRRQAELVPSRSVKLALLCAAAGLFADRLGDTPAAIALFEDAHRIDPQHPVPLEGLERLSIAADEAERLIRVLEATAQAAASPAEAAAALHQAAQVAKERLGRNEQALSLLETAHALAPEERTILHELAFLYEHGEHHEQRAAILRQLCEVTRDPHALGELFRQLGELLDEQLGRAEEAADAYRKVLAVTPGSSDALAALGKLYFRAGRWDDLIWTFQQEIETTRDTKQRATRLFKIAEIQEQRQGKVEEGVATLRRVLEVSPGYLPAQQSLTRILESAARWEDLIAFHESELAGVGEDREQVIFLLEKIARILEERLADRDGAVGAYERIVALAADHLPTVRRLQRLYEDMERWRDLIRLIEREAEVVDDQRQVIALLHRTCEILEERVGDKDAAIEAYRKVLALQPNYLPALKALGKLYHQKGLWPDLVAMYRMELEVTESREHVVGLLLKIGELFERHLLDEEEAIRTYREVLEEKPDALLALRALRRLHARRGEWDQMVDVLRRESEVIQDPAERAILLSRSAEIRELRSGRPDQAIELYLEALSHRPDHVVALRALARLYGAAGAWREVASVYERALATATPAGRVQAYRKLAHVYLDRLDEPARAAQCLEAVLADAPEDVVALSALERLYMAAGAHGKAAFMRERMAEVSDSPEVAAALLHNAALAHELLEEPPKPAAPSWQSVLVHLPDDDMAARRMEIEARRGHDYTGLLALYRTRLARSSGDDLALSLSVRIAELCMRLGDLAGAELAYREALAVGPDHLPALRGLRAILSGRDDWAEVQSLLDREGEASRDPERAIALLFEAGVLREEHLQQMPGAEDAYRKVLARDPMEPRAHARLSALLEDQERFEDLASLHALRAGHLKDPSERARAWLDAADVFQTRIADPARALEAVEQALAAQPGVAAQLERAGDLAFEVQDWPRATRLYGARAEAGGAPEALLHVRLRLGTLFQEHLSDAQRASAFFQDVLAVRPEHAEALRRLADLQKASHNWAGAVSTLARLADALPADGGRVAVLLELSDLHAGPRDDAAAATGCLEQVRALDPYERSAIERLGALYEAGEQWPKVVELYGHFVALLPEGEKALAFPLWVRIAELQQSVFGDAAKAAEAWREAIALSPDDLGPRIAVAELYTREPKWRQEAIDEHRAILARAPLRVESLHALFRLFEQQKSFDKAFCVASVLHFLGATDQDEGFFFTENKSHAPQESTEALTESEHETVLRHPDARGPLPPVLALIADQLTKVHPQDLDRHGLSHRDRIGPKDGSPVRKMADVLLGNLGGGSFDLYRVEAATGTVEVQPGEPHAVVVGSDIVRRKQMPEQRFLLGRALEHVRSGTSLCLTLDGPQLAATVQACLENALPAPPALAPRDAELARRCAKSMGRKARAALREPGQRLSDTDLPELGRFAEAVRLTADRAGALLAADVESALATVAAEHRFDPKAVPASSARALDELVRFVISEDFFRLRARLGLAIGP